MTAWLAMRLLWMSAAVNLAWDSNPESDIALYRLHYGTQPGGYTVHISAAQTTYRVTGLAFNGQYYFAATAINSLGVESKYSNEVPVKIPAPCTPFPACVQ